MLSAIDQVRPSASGLHPQGRVFAVGPLSHGAVVVAYAVAAQRGQDERSVRRTDASLSIGDALLVRRYAALLQHSPQLCGGLDGLVLVAGHEVQSLQVHRLGHIPNPPIAASTAGSSPLVVGAYIK